MSKPIVSTFLFLLSLVGFVLGFGLDPDSETYWNWQGYFDAYQIYEGAYWALFTSSLAHLDFVHLIGNLYWLWRFAPFIEERVGWRYMLLGFLALSFVSSSFELAFSGDTGLGMSGVVYGYFGYLAGKKYFLKEKVDALTLNATILFVLWAVFCIALNMTGIMLIANVAHFSGLFTGFAFSFINASKGKTHQFRKMSLGVLGSALLFSFVSLLYNPYSIEWLGHHGYRYHGEKKYEQAIEYYSKIIAIAPENAWAYYNRSSARGELGLVEASDRDYQKALELDPTIVDESE